MNSLSHSDSAFALEISSLRFRYQSGGPDVLRIPTLQIPQGQFVSLLGASGSGKSTLLRLMSGLLSPTTGTVRRQRTRPSDIGMVFQHPNLIPWRTTEQNIQLPAELGAAPCQISERETDQLLHLTGLSKQDLSKRATELSGGMQMRVALARALVLSPTQLMMDEPFGAVDDLLRMQLEEDVRRIHDERGLTTILVTHNISEAVFMSDRVLILGNRPSEITADLQVELPDVRNRETRRSASFHLAQSWIMESLQAGHDACQTA